ncbi:hypothetical protein TMRO357_01354 [Alteriqipengyuania sp. 357]
MRLLMKVGHTAPIGTDMAKSQSKKSRETRKPKKEKIKTNASNPSVKPGAIKGLENMKNS